MNLKNLKEDIFSYLGVETFTPSVNIFEYFNVTYYYEIGHYNAVSNLVSPIQLNTRHTSLLRYFNYLIFIYYRYPGEFDSERKMLKNFLMILMDKGGSRHHVYIDNALYLRNDFSTYGLKRVGRYLQAFLILKLKESSSILSQCLSLPKLWGCI